MPQASEELRREWRGPDDAYALGYLKGRGYTLDHDEWVWRHPDPGFQPTREDLRAMKFLVDEWDYDPRGFKNEASASWLNAKNVIGLNHNAFFLAVAECKWWRPSNEGGKYWTSRIEVGPDETVDHLFKRMVAMAEEWDQDTPITLRFVSRYERTKNFGERNPRTLEETEHDEP